ncbi:MAG: FAD-dependent oxidoreductase [Marinilabiliales bacterium]
MKEEINLHVFPHELNDLDKIYAKAIKLSGFSIGEVNNIDIIRKSLDARQRPIKYLVRIEIIANEPAYKKEEFNPGYKVVKNKPPVIIVGAGPAGLFAALQCLRLGLKPVIIERGKDVSARKRDVAQILRGASFNPDSNYCFGEGGAGTFSDGKLYTRSKKRGDLISIYKTLVYHGAEPSIVYESHPHIGSDKLPKIILSIRKTIIDFGGEIHFQQKLVDIDIRNNRFNAVITEKGDKFEGKALILATGHSARDIYYLFYNKKIALQPKGFAMGLRVEHPQELIDSIQYKQKIRPKDIPAAEYSISKQIAGRGVYSFCMCPGGYVVPALTEKDCTVVNGMSPSKRNSPFANSGIVVEIKPGDIPGKEKYGILAGLKFQEELEKIANINGGRDLTAPAQKLTDFINKKFSASINYYSYFPGIVPSPIHFWLPEFLYERLSKAFIEFNKTMKGFVTNEAVVYGVESRTSSPLQIVRDKATLEHPQVENLYPCGEGAGYAGGIVSAAMDGINVVNSIYERRKFR